MEQVRIPFPGPRDFVGLETEELVHLSVPFQVRTEIPFIDQIRRRFGSQAVALAFHPLPFELGFQAGDFGVEDIRPLHSGFYSHLI